MAINYEINDFDWVGNTEQTILYELYDNNSLPLTGIIIKKIVWRMVRYGELIPALEKSMIVNDDGSIVHNGIKFENNLVTVDIHHTDTATLSGKYLYQLTIIDAGDNYFVPNEGLGLIRRYITA